MSNTKVIQINKVKSMSEAVVERRLAVGRSAKTISKLEELPIEYVEKIQDAYWEEYAGTLV